MFFLHFLTSFRFCLYSDLYTVVNNPSFLCEDHFESKFIQSDNKLKPEAVPSIFKDSKHSQCRFCLKNLKDSEAIIAINQQIQSQFFSITQIELNTLEVYSQNICEKCFKSTRESSIFRSQLIRTQMKLEEEFENLEIRKETKNVQHLIDLKPNSVSVKVEQHSDGEVEIDNANCHKIKNYPGIGNDILKKIKCKKLPEVLDLKKPKDEVQTKRMCDICGTWFTRMSFKRHYDRMHLNKKNFSCDVCGYKVFKKFDLFNHIKTHFKVSTLI